MFTLQNLDREEMRRFAKIKRRIFEQTAFRGPLGSLLFLVLLIVVLNSSFNSVTPVARLPRCLSCDILDARTGDCQLSPTLNGYTAQAAVLSTIMSYRDRCRDSACITWIAYIGDSQLRSPFIHLIDMLLGQTFAPERKQLNQSNHHVDQRVCCRMTQSQAAGQDRWNADCVFTREFQTASYVRQFFNEISLLGHQAEPPRALCATWQWNTVADGNLRNVLAEYTGAGKGGTMSPDAAFAPQMIVVDPGLHLIMSKKPKDRYLDEISSLLLEMRRIAALQKQASIAPTRFVYHDITSVVDERIDRAKRQLLNQTAVIEFNDALQPVLLKALAFEDSHEWLRVFPAHRLTRHGAWRGLILARADGIHYDGAYDAIVVESDLYFMRPGSAQCFANGVDSF